MKGKYHFSFIAFCKLFLLSAFISFFKINVGVGGMSITQLLGILFLFLFLFFYRNPIKSFPIVFKDSPSILLLLYVASNFFSSFFFSLNKFDSIKSCFAILTFYFVFIATRLIAKYILNSTTIIQSLIKANNLSVIFGLASMFLSFALGSKEMLGVSLGHIGGGIPSIRSLTFEPNIFAIITACISCLSIARILYKKVSNINKLMLLLTVLAIFFAFTRSVYFSFFIAFFLLLYFLKKSKTLIIVLVLPIVITITINLIGSFANGDITEAVTNRVTNVFNIEEGSALGRLEAINIGLDGFSKNPIFGNGTMAADTNGENVFTGEIQELSEGSPGWLFGTWVQSLHDTGIIGFFIILIFFISLITKNYQNFKNNCGCAKYFSVGFIAANTILLITTQVSSIMWIAFPYVFWGANLAYINNRK